MDGTTVYVLLVIFVATLLAWYWLGRHCWCRRFAASVPTWWCKFACV